MRVLRQSFPRLAAFAIAATAAFLVPSGKGAQSFDVLRLENTIFLPGVQGRIDHMSYDAGSGRLFVAALGNNTVEVIDTKQVKRIHSISGLHEPQGVLYLADVNRLYVANGHNGTLQIFEASSYQLLKTVSLGSDADNVRFDSARKEIYVGYGAGALAILREDGSKIGDITLDAHPESFQLEKSGSRIFVNLPNSRKIAVVDRNTRKVIANWTTGQALSNFPMALDEKDHRLFIVCRKPAEMIVLDTNTGAVVATLPTVNDCDDIFYDAPSKRLYASGGEGSVSVFEQQSPDHYTELGNIITRKGARTSFLSPESHALYVAARAQGSAAAATYVYAVQR
ncbi:MAG: YncE family protein [Acidobacteriota bacterium]|nr:YncE family protein [Acidobacteriota bacterium]